MSSHPGSHPVTAHPSEGLSGTMRVPGDKSISHRSVMLGGLAIGETRVTGMLEGEDVMATAAAMRAMGASVERLVGSDGAVEWVIRGVGNGGLAEPAEVLDMGNAGTGARLLMGILATHDMTAVMTGDGSLCSRPMKRVMDPLSQFGATFMARSGGRLPLAIRGKANSVPVTYRVPMPSAQVKSAVLLAGLNAMGDSTAIEAVPTRDHTELMFAHFGIPIRTAETDDGAKAITVTGGAEIIGRPVLVPADPSSAAFPTVAALIVPDSEVTLPNVGLNPHRDGLFRTLREMGADIAYTNERREAGEPVADLVIKTSALTGIEVPSERAPSMIDEYPVLAVAAACAKGTTRMRGLAELRVKESDRLSATAAGLAACGVDVQIEGDDLIVQGAAGGRPAGGGTVAVHLDHRIAMSFLVLGLASVAPVTVDDGKAMETSFPGFAALMGGLGGRFSDGQAGGAS